MQATIEQISQITVFGGVEPEELAILLLHTQLQFYSQGEIIMHEGEFLPAKLYSLLSGSIQITKIALTGNKRFFAPYLPEKFLLHPHCWEMGLLLQP